ncbi:MAG: TraB/GumN family protein [Betaproteobacteria bacterium]|nr:TraB/GumN family protein [Betaproteobacteria bacterium]
MDRSASALIRWLAIAAALVVAAASAAEDHRFAQGLLWRVVKPGIKPSYVFGTIHVADARLADLPAPVKRAFARSTSLMLEFVADQYGRERFLEAAMFLDAQTLEEKLGREDFARVLEHLGPLGLKPEFVTKLKPWGVLLNLRSAGAGNEGSAPGVDALLYERARARRLPLHQLEDIEEQVFVFDDFPMDSQVALLRHSLAHYAELSGMAAATMKAYLARDLAALWRIQEDSAARHPEIAAHHAGFVKRILHDRSVVMAFRMQRELRKGGTFIAVGALHLYGGKGVLALLVEDGWKVARVY